MGTNDHSENPEDLGGDDRTSATADRSSLTPIVGVGASAGGLDAFAELLAHIPSRPSFAIVLVQHLQPDHDSDLAAILGRKTSMPVVQAEHGMLIEPAHVYVIPPNVEMRVDGRSFVLSPRPSGTGLSLTVDIFLESLAEQRGDRATGVILSGSAHDGTLGLAAIKAKGGITLVQDPDTAAHAGMPESAIAANVADLVLPIEEIASELIRLSGHPYLDHVTDFSSEQAPRFAAEDEAALVGVISLVRSNSGLDLSHYKRATLLRRVGRRMVMRHADSLEAYMTLLESDADEMSSLLAEVLVRVTSFFRDPELFAALKTEILPSIVDRKSSDGIVRVWVPGCATGQEAYSIAMLLLEYLEDSGSRAKVQIFASDLREDDLAIARRGIYSADIESEVGSERFGRFFTRTNEGYRISPAIREMCVFARHDVTNDPPFARLDLVSCRNLLIYLDGTMQRRLLGLFHYALVPDGYLFLGSSEGIGSARELFERTNTKGVMQRLPGDAREYAGVDRSRSFSRLPLSGSPTQIDDAEGGHAESDAARQLDALLLDRYAPAAVLVDDRLRIRQVRGDASEYLRLTPGDATLDLIRMLPVGLAGTVNAAVEEARATGRSARRNAIREQQDGEHRGVLITVAPVVTDDGSTNYAVFFSEGAVTDEGADSGVTLEADYLRQELSAAGERIRALTEGRDAVHESLRAAHEEVQSSNEELQSMNEELETAKEELQSTNEELTTLNDELRARNSELGQRNDDLMNLLQSASIAMLVLGPDMTIRRFTTEAADLFNLIPGDVGRRLTDVNWRLKLADLDDLLAQVVESSEPARQEIEDDTHHWFDMTVTPYVTSDGSTDGTVVTLLDIDSLHRSRAELMRAGLMSESLNRIGVALDSVKGGEESLNKALSIMCDAVNAAEVQLISRHADVWTLTAACGDDASKDMQDSLSAADVDRLGLRLNADGALFEESLEDGSCHLVVPLLSAQKTVLGALRLRFADPNVHPDQVETGFATRAALILTVYLEREHHAEILDGLVAQRTIALEEAMAQLELATGVKNAFLANMSHELRTPLNSIIGFSRMLLSGLAGDLNAEQHRQIEMVLSAGNHLLDIVSDLLDIERITAGAMPLTVTEFRLGDVISTVGELLAPLAASKGLKILLPDAETNPVLLSDEIKVRQLLLNLLSNAIKFTEQGSVAVAIDCDPETCTITVTDTGCGMTPEQLEEAFEEFRQVNQTSDHLTDGTGLGLSIAARLAGLLGGSLSAVSEPGVGSTFTAVLAQRIKPTRPRSGSH